MISYAMPILRGREANSRAAQSAEMWSFWIMTIGMGVMVLALTGAGILQVWLQRIPTENPMVVHGHARPAALLLLAALVGRRGVPAAVC